MSKLHTVFPNSKKATYKPSDTVDFKLSFKGRKYVKNSLRVSGKLQIAESAGTIVDDDTNLFYDSSTGVHCCFSKFSTTMDHRGAVENMDEYPRLYKMEEVSRVTKSHEVSSALNLCELKVSADNLTNKAMAGMAAGDYAVPFSFKPDIGMNNLSADLSFRKCGQVNIQTRLEAQNKVLYGSGAGNANVILFTDLQIQYRTVPDDNSNEEVVMFTKHSLKQVLDSSSGHVSTTVPAVCISASCSFLPTANDSNYNYNQTELAMPPGVSRVQFSWNDMTTGYLSFPLENLEEILFNYLQSMGSTGHNQMTFKHLSAGNNYGAGLKFPSPVDLTSQSFGIELTSDIDNTNPYYIYMVFRAIQKL